MVPLGSQIVREKVIGMVRQHLYLGDMPKEVLFHLLESVELQLRYWQNRDTLSKFRVFGER